MRNGIMGISLKQAVFDLLVKEQYGHHHPTTNRKMHILFSEQASTQNSCKHLSS